MNSKAAINNLYDNFQGPAVSIQVMFYWDQPFLVGVVFSWSIEENQFSVGLGWSTLSTSNQFEVEMVLELGQRGGVEGEVEFIVVQYILMIFVRLCGNT